MKIYGLNGLVLSTAFAAVLNGLCLMVVLLWTKALVIDASFLRFLAVSVVSSFLSILLPLVGAELLCIRFFQRILLLGAVVVGSVGIYFSFMYVLGVPESRTLLVILKRKIKRI
ncbi:MAG: hypothetical protein H6623_05545 [Bdellovibrionaceae bacterium]|nr:hypothetical protein [Pseudobdellovibrionaceae bacterium]